MISERPSYAELMNRHTDFKGRNPREVVNLLKEERQKCKDFNFKNPRAFKLELVKLQGRSATNAVAAGYYVPIDGKKFVFSDQAYQQLCMQLGMQAKYFKKYPDAAEFVEHVNKLLPLKMKQGIIVRTQEHKVRAVVPHNYKILDDDQVMEVFYGISKELPNFKGIEAFRGEHGESNFYRLVFGNSAVEHDAIFPTLVVGNSETDEAPFSVNLGTFRVRCGNGSISQGIDVEGFSWNHRGDFRTEIPKIRLSVNRIVRNAATLATALKKAHTSPLEGGFENEVSRMNQDMRMVSRYYVDALKNFASSTNAQPKTKLDVFNVMTLMAQKYKVPSVRREHEKKAHRYLVTG